MTLTIDAEEAHNLPEHRGFRGVLETHAKRTGSAGSVASAAEDREQRAELDLGLGQLGRRVGVAHDAAARRTARASRPRSSAQRSATQNSPSSLASVHPTGPAYQPRSSPSKAGIRGVAAACGSPPTAGVGCSRPASSIALRGCVSCARIGVARCWMLATLTIAGSSGAVTQTACGRSARAIRRVDDRLLLAVLLGAQQLLAEVVVDRRVGRAAGRAGERDGRGAQALAADQQLRRGAR